MCKYGTYKLVKVNYRNLDRCIDACISDEIKNLNKNGIITLNCCCGHGDDIPKVLIKEISFNNMINLGYKFIRPIYYEDDKSTNVFEFELQSGCRTFDEISEWHINHKEEVFFKGFAEQ